MTEDIPCCRPLVFSTASEPSIMFCLPEQAAYTIWSTHMCGSHILAEITDAGSRLAPTEPK